MSQPVSYGSASFHYLFSIEPQVLYCQGLSCRGDWTAFELFVRGVDAWGDDVKRLVMAA